MLMYKQYSKITLNHIHFNKHQLEKAINQISSFSPFVQSVLSFIAEWLNDKDYITVKTSGSTGNPQQIKLKKSSLIQSALQTQKFFNLNSSHTALLCLPVDYIAGKMMIVRAFVIGFDLVLAEPTSNPLEAIHEPIDFAAVTPYQLYHMAEKLSDNFIKMLIVGGSDISTSLLDKVQSTSTQIYATYGMTETCSHVALRKLNGNEATNVYTALENIRFSVDENHCLIIDAPGITDQPLVTKDVVKLLDSTHFIWLGRYDFVINSGGIKIFPEQVEQKLANIISYPFFIGWQPDEKLYQRVVLFIEKENISEDEKLELFGQIKSILPNYEQPKQIINLKRFKYSKNGKLLRRETMKLLT